MTWSVFVETLRRGWRTMIYWGIGIGLIGVLNIIAVPSVDGMKATAEALSKLPPFVVQMVGGGDLVFLSSPAGYLNNQYFATILVFFGLYAIIVGLSVTSTEEDKLIMDVLLTLPIQRWRVIVEKFAAYALMSIGVIGISTALLSLGLQMTPSVSIDRSIILQASFSILPGTLIMLAFTIFIATVVRRRAYAMSIAAVFLVGSWFIDILGRTATTSIANTARVASFYSYYDTAQVMQHGLSLLNVTVPLVAAAILMVGAVWSFQRRNISV